MTDTEKNLFQRLHAIMEEVGVVPKDKDIKNKGGVTMYSVTTSDAVTGALNPLFIKHRVLATQSVEKYGTAGNRTHAHTVIEFINVDNPDERYSVKSFGFGVDAQDKGPGKAMSYAMRYGLSKVFSLQTGEDPEHDQSKHAPLPPPQSPPPNPGTPPPVQPPVAPPPPVQNPPPPTPAPHPQASPPPGGPPQSPDNGMDMLLAKTCKYEEARSSGRLQYAVEIHVCDGIHKGKDFTSRFGLEIHNGDPKDEPYPHRITRRFLACLNLDIKTVQKNPEAFCNRIAEQYFKAELEEGTYFNKKQQKDVYKLDIKGKEMTSAYDAPQAAPADQQTLPPPPGAAPPPAPPPPIPGAAGVPGLPDDVELDADIDLEEDEDYLSD